MTKNLVTFRRRNGIKDANFNMGVHCKIQFLGGDYVKLIQRKDCLKRGASIVF